MTEQQEKQKQIMKDLLQFINRHSDQYVLKGGAGLMFGYGLDRFSEDIDLDSNDCDTVKKLINLFCVEKGFECSIEEDDDLLQRFMIRYPESKKPLKVAISFRTLDIPDEVVTINDGIAVYKINELSNLKLSTYLLRDRLRDLFDLCFICNNYFNDLTAGTILLLSDVFIRGGLKHCDYLIYRQHDELIDKDKLRASFLEAFGKLGFQEKRE